MGRILVVGDTNARGGAGRLHYASVRKLIHGFIRDGHWVMEFADRDIARQGWLARGRTFGAPRVNRVFLETCANLRPDLVVLCQSDLLTAQTLTRARNDYGALVAYVNLDASARNHVRQRVARYGETADAFFSTDARVARLGEGRFLFIPNPLDEALETGRNATEVNTDILFAAGGEASDPRVAFAQALRLRLPKARWAWFGQGAPMLWGEAYLAALRRARVVLCFNRYEGSLYASDRLAQAVGCGAVAAVMEGSGLARFYADGKEMLILPEDADAASARLRSVLASPATAEAIALAGRAKMLALASSCKVSRFIWETTTNAPNPTPWHWPHRV